MPLSQIFLLGLKCTTVWTHAANPEGLTRWKHIWYQPSTTLWKQPITNGILLHCDKHPWVLRPWSEKWFFWLRLIINLTSISNVERNVVVPWTSKNTFICHAITPVCGPVGAKSFQNGWNLCWNFFAAHLGVKCGFSMWINVVLCFTRWNLWLVQCDHCWSERVFWINDLTPLREMDSNGTNTKENLRLHVVFLWAMFTKDMGSWDALPGWPGVLPGFPEDHPEYAVWPKA